MCSTAVPQTFLTEPQIYKRHDDNDNANDNSNEIYLEVTQTTLLCPAVAVGRHSRHKRAGYEGSVQLHFAVVDFYGLQQSIDGAVICCWQWQWWWC